MDTTLLEITEALRACRHCSMRFQKTATAHQPNPIFQVSQTARLCIAGQAPGLRAHKASKTFSDPSGVRLRSWMGVSEQTFYDSSRIAILPMAFCFPGYDSRNSDLPPPPDCARLWRQRLFDAMPQLELIVTVGKSALAWHLSSLRSKPLSESVRCGIVGGMPAHLPLPHPSWRNNAWLKGNPWFETDILPVLRSEVSRLVG